MKSAIKTGVVTEFRGDYAFLSNHYTAVFEWRSESFFCVEQAFQYAKTFYPKHPGDKLKCSDMAMRLRDTGNGATAKKYGREIPVDLDMWTAMKVSLMREIVHAKFATSRGDNLAGMLINTGAMMLVEGNDWGDTFWGRCNGQGLNTLGVILMEERGSWLRSSTLS